MLRYITFKGGPLDDTTTMVNEDVHCLMLQEIDGKQHIVAVTEKSTGDTQGNIIYKQSIDDASIFEVQE